MNKILRFARDILLSAQLAKLKVDLDRLRNVDLPAAHVAIGEAAYRGNLLISACSAEHAELCEIDGRIAAFDAHQSARPAPQTGTEVAQRALEIGSGNTARQLLMEERRDLLMRIGEALRREDCFLTELAPQHAIASSVATQIAALEEKLKAVSSLASRLAQRPALMFGVLAASGLALLIAYSGIASKYAAWKTNRDVSEMAQKLAFEREKLSQALQTKAAFDAEQVKIKAAKQLEAEEQKKAKAEAAIKAERAQNLQSQMARQAALEEARDENIAQREAKFEAAAAEAFAKINLTPNVTISGNLKDYDSTVTAAGANLQKYRELIGQAEWEKLVNLIEWGTVEKLHNLSPSFAKAAASKLDNMQFAVMVHTAFRPSRTISRATGHWVMTDKALLAVVFQSEATGTPNCRLLEAQLDPSRTGYYFDWHPRDGEMVIFIGDTEANQRGVANLNGVFQRISANLDQKIKLGELGKEEKQASLQAIASQWFNNFVKPLR